MAERLIIKRFAGIKEIDITLSDINVFIGPQASGKSVCAKSLYYFKSFVSSLLTAVENEQTKRQFDKDFLQRFEHYFPSYRLNDNDFLLRYEITDLFVQVESAKSKLKLSYSEYFAKELSNWRSTFRRSRDNPEHSEQALSNFEAIRLIRRRYFAIQAQQLGEVATYAQIFIPAGRSFFAILQNSIFSFLANNKAIDPFLTEFGSFYEKIKYPRVTNSPRDEEGNRLKSKIDRLTESVLQGRHIFEKGHDFLQLTDGRKIGLENSSSGQQEMLPLALILGSIPFTRALGSGGNTVYIEEPEAHLFPTAQRSIVNLVATIFNQSKVPVQFIITTHSPYILAAFNNLLQAGNTAVKLDGVSLERLERIVPEEQLLQSASIRVYSLHQGLCQSIMSVETGLISTNLLDAISDELATQFDHILDIE